MSYQRASGDVLNNNDNQARNMQARINAVERHLGNICQTVGAYIRGVAKMRNKGDDVARAIIAYAEHEQVQSTSRKALVGFAQKFSAIQDYRNTEVQRLEVKVSKPLSVYGPRCRHAKERMRLAFAARDREIRESNNYRRTLSSGHNDPRFVTQAQNNAQIASVTATKAAEELEKEMEKFEMDRITGTKNSLAELVQIEMVFHAKCLELYTQCYQSLSSIDEESDLQQFRSSLGSKTLQQTRQQQLQQSRGGRTSRQGSVRDGGMRGGGDLNSTGYSQSSYAASTQRSYNDDEKSDDDEEEEDDDDDYTEGPSRSSRHLSD